MASETSETNMGSQLTQEIALPDVGNDYLSHVKYVADTYHHLKHLAVQLKKDRVQPLDRCEKFLAWADYCLEMTPRLIQGTPIEGSLKIITNPEYKFPEPLVQKAAMLLDRWDSENWGQDFVFEEPSDGEDNATSPVDNTTGGAVASSGRNRNGPGDVTYAFPPVDHAIFGEHGIMHGVVISKGKRRDYRINMKYTAKNAKAFGHNGLQVGAWYPMQIVALFNGAHGHRQGGIAGSEKEGAYSIVVSGTYDDLDSDKGETIFYSGSKSHQNTDPNYAGDSTNATRALKKSLATQRPVRVLRSANRKRYLAPAVGMRYDGLYRVTAQLLAKNQRGGLYEQFKLERLPGQPDLDTIARDSPTLQQRRDYYKIQDGY